MLASIPEAQARPFDGRFRFRLPFGSISACFAAMEIDKRDDIAAHFELAEERQSIPSLCRYFRSIRIDSSSRPAEIIENPMQGAIVPVQGPGCARVSGAARGLGVCCYAYGLFHSRNCCVFSFAAGEPQTTFGRG